MALYLVRWPRMEASLVNAADEQELINIIDELDTPTACTWSEYDGPLWIDVDLNLKVRVEGPFEKVSAAIVAIVDTKPLLHHLLKFSSPSTGTAEAMRDEIMERVFPNTHAAFEKALNRAAKLVDFDDSGGLLPTRTLYFVRRTRCARVFLWRARVASVFRSGQVLLQGAAADGHRRDHVLRSFQREGGMLVFDEWRSDGERGYAMEKARLDRCFSKVRLETVNPFEVFAELDQTVDGEGEELAS